MDLVETYRRSFILSAHGAILPYLPPIDLQSGVFSNIRIISYGDMGDTVYCDRPDPNRVCGGAGSVRNFHQHARPHFNSFPEMLFYRDVDASFRSGVMECCHQGLRGVPGDGCQPERAFDQMDSSRLEGPIIDLDEMLGLQGGHQAEIALSNILTMLLQYTGGQPFNLHVLTCLELIDETGTHRPIPQNINDVHSALSLGWGRYVNAQTSEPIPSDWLLGQIAAAQQDPFPYIASNYRFEYNLPEYSGGRKKRRRSRRKKTKRSRARTRRSRRKSRRITRR